MASVNKISSLFSSSITVPSWWALLPLTDFDQELHYQPITIPSNTPCAAWAHSMGFSGILKAPCEVKSMSHPLQLPMDVIRKATFLLFTMHFYLLHFLQSSEFTPLPVVLVEKKGMIDNGREKETTKG